MSGLTEMMDEISGMNLDVFSGLDIMRALACLEAMRDLDGLYPKLKALVLHQMAISDGIFFSIFDDSEIDLLFALEDLGYLETGITRLSG